MSASRLARIALLSVLSFSAKGEPCPETLDFRVKRLNSDETVHLCEAYAGKVLLVVNTASKCAFTPQYEGLEKLHSEYRGRGFAVLGFPSNDFGAQEPGSEARIQNFCRLTYGVKFPMFEKTHSAREKADPIYRTLGTLANEYPSWNFHKYLIDRRGRLVASFKSWITPEDPHLREALEDLL
jgi:glutathione peroxidase